MFPFSFAEYCQAAEKAKEEAFAKYVRTGGFPCAIRMASFDENPSQSMEGIYHSILVKDIAELQNLKTKDPNKRYVIDLVLLKTVSRALASQSGSPASAFLADGRKVYFHTISDCIQALCGTCLFYRVERMDVTRKEPLKSNPVFYMADLSMKHWMIPKESNASGCEQKIVVYLELIRRGYKVYTGKRGALAVDFAAQKD